MELQRTARTALHQRQTLSQTLRQAVAFMALPGAELAEQLAQAAEANPYLRLTRPRATAPAVEIAADAPSLIAHVLTQLPLLVPDRRQHPLALALAEALDASGYLVEPLASIALRAGQPEAALAQVLADLQQIEPAGLFARSLAECLSLQLRAENRLDPAFAALLDHLPLLAQGRHADLARLCGVAPDRLATMAAQLRRLDPRPGAGFSFTPPPPRLPDVTFTETETGWQARLSPDAMPALHLVPRQSGTSADQRRTHHEARRIVTAMDLRNRSLLAVAEAIARHQPEALRHGPAALRPLTRRTLAETLNLHETTIGRIVRHATAQINGTVIPLAAFFARPCNSDETACRSQILALMQQRLTQGPASDATLSRWLAEQGLNVPRRRIAKYRAAAHIPARAHSG
ncbi:RNA polymerase, sigma 54 subunit, RpoN/SigL [Gemmobacter aquatilis]|uniref:RNA polymerase sigma-54 factor n=1 Tax=Gemmobacter aquatilis TaxID=933059 RepID=A0A1H8A215_9RHOB|nr:hypothetical protein [Gemmobacter aquatilis]SEM64750.1 RNA polymerase, sigma 54 subunit, RpoN/SigL [Gemmobacter aquatilis]